MTAMLGGTSSNAATITVTLKDDRSASSADVAEEFRKQCSDITGATISIEASNSAMAMSTDEIEFRFTGGNEDELEKYVIEAEAVLATVDGVSETSTSISETKSEVAIKLDPAKSARYGMNTATAATLIKNALDGTTASRYSEGGTEYDIVVEYPEDYIANYNQLKNTQLKTFMGQWITLSDIADVTIEQGQTTLTRVDQQRVYTITGKLYGTDMATVNKKFNEKLAAIPKPDGVTQEAGGNFETMIDAMLSLVLAIVLGIILMYLVMAAQFESLSQPAIIMFTLPLAFIGVVLALLVTFSPLSVISCIGILMLVGIIVNNGIVLIDFINAKRKDNPDKDRNEIIVYGGLARIRPVLMTSLTTILGFIPMALDTSSGGAMMAPLAQVLIGGLTVGTFLTLYVIPTVYSIFDDKLKKRKYKKSKVA